MSENFIGIKEDAQERMTKAIGVLSDKLKIIRTGRPNSALFSKIMVTYYGTPTPLAQVANISIPESRIVVLQAWDKTILPEIEKSIRSSDLGINPSNDGNVIRLNFPVLTEERRKEIIKQTRTLGEETRVALRNIRRDINDFIKKAKKNSLLTEDEEKKTLDEIQKTTDDFIKKVDVILAGKEKEVLEE